MVEANNKPRWPREGYNEEWLALEDATGGRFILPKDISKCKDDFNTTFAAIAKTWPPLEESIDVWDDNTGPEYGSMPVRFYKPKSDKPLPLMIHFPGGGFICGNLDTEDYQARYFAVKTPCLVISVHYPLSPEVNSDQIIEHGSWQSNGYCRSKASSAGADPSKTLLCGGSAGSILSEQVAYHFTSTGQHDVISGCVLLYTAAAHWTYDGPYKYMHKSWDELGYSQVPLFGLEVAERVWEKLEIRPQDPRHFVMVAEDLSKFPPCYLVSAGKDCWRDGGKMMEHRLKEVGVKCKYDFYPGLPHWFHVFPQLTVSHEMMRKTVDGIRFLLE